MNDPNFFVMHWDTFDNETLQIAVADTFKEANEIVQEKYGDRIQGSGADVVEIVDSKGNIVAKFNIG